MRLKFHSLKFNKCCLLFLVQILKLDQIKKKRKMVCTVGIYANLPPIVNPIVWLQASTLQATHTDGSVVTSWEGVIAGLPSATSYSVGGGSLPIYTTSGNPFPYVNINQTPSSTVGCYADFGPLTLPISPKGIVGIAVFRFRKCTDPNWNAGNVFKFTDPTTGLWFHCGAVEGYGTRSFKVLDGKSGIYQTSSNTSYLDNTWTVAVFRYSINASNCTSILHYNNTDSSHNPSWTPRSTPPYYFTKTNIGTTTGVLDLAELGLWSCEVSVAKLRQISRKLQIKYGIS